MAEQIKIQRIRTLICDMCGKREEKEKAEGWYIFTEVESKQLRLYEKPDDGSRYESFNIPNKKKKTYCTRGCAKRSLSHSLDLFLSELSPIKKPSRHKPFRQ